MLRHRRLARRRGRRGAAPSLVDLFIWQRQARASRSSSGSGSGSSISAVPGRASIIRRRRCVTEDTHVTSTRQQSRPTGLGLRRQVVVIILVFC